MPSRTDPGIGCGSRSWHETADVGSLSAAEQSRRAVYRLLEASLQEIFGARLWLGLASESIDARPDRARAVTAAVGQQLTRLEAAMRAHILALSLHCEDAPCALDGVLTAVVEQFDWVMNTETSIEVSPGWQATLSPAVSQQVILFVANALATACTEAPTMHATVSLSQRDDGGVCVEVRSDRRCQADDPLVANGLEQIREHARLAGGALRTTLGDRFAAELAIAR